MNPIHYLALGDSIATGCITYWRSTTGYPWYIYRRLQQENKGNRPVYYTNLAHNGDCTWQLLHKLHHHNGMIAAVIRANIITVSIGGNDVLRSATIPGFTQIYLPAAKMGVQACCKYYPQIVQRIRQLNPQARLVTMSVYNPYCRAMHLSTYYNGDKGLHFLANKLLVPVNCCIQQAAAAHSCLFADAHSLFDSYSYGDMHRVVSLYAPQGGYLLRNPHPTSMGHKLIGQLHTDLLFV